MAWFSRLRREGLNRHFIFIEAQEKIVGPEVIRWGESSWWPKRCTMKFIRRTPGELRVGTRFEQRVVPLGPRWEVEVTGLVENRRIERTFLNGLFHGREIVTSEGRLNGTRVDYVMQYKIRGLFNKVLWPLVFRRLHDKNIQMILAALKEYAVNKQKDL